MSEFLADCETEVDRLTTNNLLFFEISKDMLFIINDECIIENMNPQAINVFGDNRGQNCIKAIFGNTKQCDHANCPVKQHETFNGFGQLYELKIHDNFFVECSYSIFKGYKKDKLILASMRDITKRKQEEQRLKEYQDSLKMVLENKIHDLAESEKTKDRLLNEVNYLKKDINRLTSNDKMVGECRSIRIIREMIYKIAPTDATVLITGESGTGKELIADLIYNHSNRTSKPYLKFNCASIPDSLLESDLFGYEKGAFTGAGALQKGKFEVANTGTIFLDEIGDISPRMQAALLRVLQNGEIVRVGGTHPIKVDVRIISATNSSLVQAVKEKRFRQDLYYRLNVFNLDLPSLRDRKEDIVPLAIHMLKKYREAFHKKVDFFPDEVVQALLEHDWPGNIRELENIIQRAVLLSKDNMISLNEIDLPETIQSRHDIHSAEEITLADKPLKDLVAAYEGKCLKVALRKFNGETKSVAERLNVGKTALYEKMKRHNLSPKQFKT